MIEMKVTATGAQQLFEELAKKVENTRPAMVEIAEMLFDSVTENFAEEGRPKWKELSKARIQERSKDRLVSKVFRHATWPGKILREMGGLEDSLSRRATNSAAVVGANIEYAATHQFGDPTRNIPARPFLVVRSEDVAEAETILLKHLGIANK